MNDNKQLPKRFFRVANDIIQDLNMGVLLITVSGMILEINPMALELLDIHIEYNEWKHVRLDSVIPENRDEFRLLQKIITSRYPYRNYLVNWERNGTLHHVLIDSYIVRNMNGEFDGVCICMKDVGNFISLEQQIQRNEKLATVGKIAAGVAHEIRNPLTSIKGFLQVIRDDMEENGITKYNTYTSVMLAEIERINGLVNEFLLLSKPKNIKFQLVSIIEVLEELQPIIKSEALLHNIELYFQLSEVPSVFADSEMLKQVFLNLMKNAIEAMPTGGTLTVSTTIELADKYVKIDFHDTGVGIPHYMMDRIFDAFFTTKETGTGLGLPICQRIISDFGGYIRVSNKGFGTTFSVFLPLEENGM